MAFAEAEWYLKAAFESGNTWQMVLGNLSHNVNGMFWVANKTAIFISADAIFWSMASSGTEQNVIFV